MRSLLCIGLILSFMNVHATQDSYGEQIRICSAETNAFNRLECFDAIAKKVNNDTGDPAPQRDNPGQIAESVGAWNLNESRNPIDDSTTVTGILTSKNAKNYLGRPVRLVLRCQSNKTEAYVSWQDYLGGDDVWVTDRIDSKEASTLKWSLSTDQKASFRPKPIEFIKALYEAQTYVAQVTPYNESPVTALFDLSGVKSVVTAIRKECSW